MRIIIMGAGKVGFHIAEILSAEGHNLTIIENFPDREQIAREKIDAMVIYGDGASEDILLKAGIDKADIFIGVTDRDEVNILACMLAKEYGVPLKIARIKNMSYNKTVGKISPEKMGIDFMINPRNVVAHEICNMVSYLDATEAAEFAKGQVVYICYSILKDNPLSGIQVMEMVTRVPDTKFVLMSITREGQVFIPKVDDFIKEGDLVSFICKKKDLNTMRGLFGLGEVSAKNVFLLGAGEVGYEVSKRLINKKHNVKIMDRDPGRCEQLAGKLPENALILCSDSTDADTLRSEGVDKTDVFISVTEDDQTNILGSLLAKRCGVKRTVVVVNRPDLTGLATSLGITACVSPRIATASAILKFIRGKMVFSVARIDHYRAEVIEFELPEDSTIVNKPIRDLNIPDGIKIGAIFRKNNIIIPSGTVELHQHDHVIVLCLINSIAKAEKFFS